MPLREKISERVECLASAMGSALYQAQGVEEMLAKYYSIAFKLSESSSTEEMDSEFERNFSHTAGRLVGLLREKRGALDPIAKRLSFFVDERAWLVHKLRRTNYHKLRDEKGFNQIIQRISDLEKESEELIDLFHNLLVEHFVNLGFPRKFINKEIAKEIRRVYGE